jgi:transcription initiation factor TFIID subunit 5
LAAHNSFRLSGHAGPVYAVDFSPDHQFVFSASADHTVRLWNMELKVGIK